MNQILIFHLSHLPTKGLNLVCVMEDLSDPAVDIIDIVIHDIETVGIGDHVGLNQNTRHTSKHLHVVGMGGNKWT